MAKQIVKEGNRYRVFDSKPDSSIPNDLSVSITKETSYRIKQTQRTWREALEMAEDVRTPLRYELYRTYKDVMIDNHLTGIINLMQSKITSTDFTIVDSKGNTSDELVDKFNQKWFFDFLKLYIETIYYGHSLIQIDSVTNGYINSVSLIDRDYVSPEKGLILVRPEVLSGYKYRGTKEYNWIIELGKDNDLGLLHKISPYALYKKSALQFWNEYTELFGVPFRIAKTKSMRPEDKQRLFRFMKDMGSSGFGIVNENDTIDILDPKQVDAYSVYLELIKLLNGEMSKVVLGGTEGVDGASGGSEARANVHNSQTDAIISSLLRDIHFYINDELIDQLVYLGVMQSSEYKFKWINKEKLNLIDRASVDKDIASNMIGKLDTEYLQETYGVVVDTNAMNTNANTGL